MNDLALPPLEDLPSVGLADLNNEAALLTRKDRKYLVPLEVARVLLAQDGLLVLEIDGRRSFRTESA